MLQKAILEFDNGTVPTYVGSPETLGVASAPKDETEISLSGSVSLTVDKTAPRPSRRLPTR